MIPKNNYAEEQLRLRVRLLWKDLVGLYITCSSVSAMPVQTVPIQNRLIVEKNWRTILQTLVYLLVDSILNFKLEWIDKRMIVAKIISLNIGNQFFNHWKIC